MHRFVNVCNCGKCEECVKLEQAQWYLRMYWQAKLFFDRGGYLIYDTLSYADPYLKHLSDYFDGVVKGSEVDFSVVSYEDIRDFLKRLRTTLTRKGYDVRNNVKYFIASEYGSDDKYVTDYGEVRKGTMRPHYHCLFYVDIDPYDLPPKTFMRICQECWKNGNTDNYKVYGRGGSLLKTPYYGPKVNENVFCRNYGVYRSDDVSLRKVTNYVSKYIRKSDKYTDMVECRVQAVFSDYVSTLRPYDEVGPRFSHIEDDRVREWLLKHFKSESLQSLRNNYSEKEIYKEIKSEIRKKIGVFHKQSQGFGMYAIDILSDEDRDYLIRTGNMRMQDQGVVREIPCPMYYVRKLFYNYRVGKDGRVQWYLTETGLSAMKQMSYYKVARMGRRYMEWFMNLDNANASELFNYDIPDIRSMVTDILDGRDFNDLALYSLYYRGRILYQYHCPDDAMPTVDDIMDMQNEYHVDFSDKWCLKCDGSVKYMEEDELPWSELKTRKYRDFYREYCINEDTEFEGEKRFRNFDLLLDVIAVTGMPAKQVKEHTMKAMDGIKDRLRGLGYKISQ